MLVGIWCSELEICTGERIDNTWQYSFDNCLADATIIDSGLAQAIMCANKEESDTASQNKNGIWCSDITTTASTQNMYIGYISRLGDYYCNNNITTYESKMPNLTPAITPDITPVKTPPPRTYQECKYKDTCKSKIKFNVLMSILSFILNE